MYGVGTILVVIRGGGVPRVAGVLVALAWCFGLIPCEWRVVVSCQSWLCEYVQWSVLGDR